MINKSTLINKENFKKKLIKSINSIENEILYLYAWLPLLNILFKKNPIWKNGKEELKYIKKYINEKELKNISNYIKEILISEKKLEDSWKILSLKYEAKNLIDNEINKIYSLINLMNKVINKKYITKYTKDLDIDEMIDLYNFKLAEYKYILLVISNNKKYLD